MKNFSASNDFCSDFGSYKQRAKIPIPMKLIFLSTAFAGCVLLTSCSSQSPQSQSPSTTSTPLVISTPAPTPSPTQLTDAEKQNRDKLAKELDRIDLEFRERQEKLDQERRENKLCRSQEALADFSPNDDTELSAECKKRLADLDKGASKTH